MKIRNMDNTANLAIDLLDSFDIKLKTYKLGGSINGEYNLNNQLSVNGSYSLNFQTGKMENGTLGSNISIDGAYHSFNIGVKYAPGFLSHFFITGGYDYKMWDYGSTTVNTPVGSVKIARGMDIDFKMSGIYLGAGYQFH